MDYGVHLRFVLKKLEPRTKKPKIQINFILVALVHLTFSFRGTGATTMKFIWKAGVLINNKPI